MVGVGFYQKRRLLGERSFCFIWAAACAALATGLSGPAEPTLQSLTFAGKESETGNSILRQLLHLGVQIRSFTEILPSLNDIFIRTVGAAAPAS